MGWREESGRIGAWEYSLDSGGIRVGRKKVGEGDIEEVGGCRCQIVEDEGEAAGG